MNEFFPDRVGVLAKAARLMESGGLTVLDRDCQAGGHRLDLVAVTSGGTLVAVEVRTAEPEGVRADAANLGIGRMLEILHAGAAWMYASDGPYADFRVDVVVFSRDGSGETLPGRALTCKYAGAGEGEEADYRG
jgi:Holliday junction resolvase-like predicted endonuclease